MASDDKDPSGTEAQLESLVAAAEQTRANRRTPRKQLNVEDAETTLNSLLEAADEAGQKQLRKAHRHETRKAMDDLFADPRDTQGGCSTVLVGLDDLGGVDGSIDDSMDEEPTIAGAEDAQKVRKPERKLDDGIDFWSELETIDRDPDGEY